ncbi:hypothetical protein CPC08DRAFT_787768 [Agrocybe pediades]|nr:hypothetical protein CPC08DRAFT_787768 [Agrocybe pediades]
MRELTQALHHEEAISWPRTHAIDYDSSLPLTLLHPVFRQFVDDCKHYQPTTEDIKFAIEFQYRMTVFMGAFRAESVITGLEKAGISFVQEWGNYVRSEGSHSDYHPGGVIDAGDFHSAILMTVNEVGIDSREGSEPYAESIFAYIRFTEKGIQKHPRFNFPCFLLTVLGMCFSGMVWTDRPCYQVLAPTVPLFWNDTDRDMRLMFVRQIGAFRNARTLLQRCYDILATPRFPKDLDPIFPDPRQYVSVETGETIKFDYVRKAVPKSATLVFMGTTSAHEDICIKYTQPYSKEAHMRCAAMGIAPPLRGFQDIGSGWFMVVMDALDLSTYQFIQKSWERNRPTEGQVAFIRARLEDLHAAGFVHGDLRACNPLIPKTGEDGAMFIDFDFAGEIGKTVYPEDIETEQIARPEDVTPYGLVLPEHDIAMLGYIVAHNWELQK